MWKIIEGYENYSVNELGQVKNNKRNHIMKVGKDKDGYGLIALSKNNIGKTYKVHRLVAIAFIQNPENKPQVNHINGIKNDNRLENLEWCTSGENQKHSFDFLNRQSPMKGKIGKDNHCSKPVKQLTLSGELIKIFSSAEDVFRELGIFASNISCVCHGRQKTAGGFKWEHAKQI